MRGGGVNNPSNSLYVGGKRYEVYPPEYLKEIEVDKVFVSIMRPAWVTDIMLFLQNLNIKNIELDLRHTFIYARKTFVHEMAELMVMRGIQGSVAELGVYKGELAKYINAYFKDDTFYLLDTFEDFDKKDTEHENSNNLSTASVGDFSDTSIDGVKRKMPHIDKCRFVQGYSRRLPVKYQMMSDLNL